MIHSNKKPIDYLNKKTGLDENYTNIWFGIGFTFSNYLEILELMKTSKDNDLVGMKENLLETLRKPIKTYQEHIMELCPENYEEVLDSAQPKYKKQLDNVIEEYNSLHLEKRLIEKTINKYNKRTRNIITGINLQN